ncbi:1,4-alpha-glucan branching protein GlgB [Paenibacillus sp. FSL W7-1287]|uniref:1,4-alpha-glucan branching protein GlgB n=1 Tax=Paenibacillus sp. FSL W7-1287 TaxID=2954538 RepID=UPI0030F914AC
MKKSYWGISPDELYLFNCGLSHHSYRFMGAHPMSWNGQQGVRFAVWAPEARQVAIVTDEIGWDTEGIPLTRVGSTGIHIGFIEGMQQGTRYKYRILTANGDVLLKSDPYAFYSERRPNTASIVYGLNDFEWSDQAWYEKLQQAPSYQQPLLIYEAHAGSWRIKGKEHYYTYEELADLLIPYVIEWGYTHIELLPLMEHPLDQSWGYQVTGFYSPTSRYGNPDQLKHFINECHKQDIGVILDWVPGHFCKDNHGLRCFDGSPIYEGADWKRAELPLWGTLSFDYARSEVISFLLSNAIYWIDSFHFDGLRVDAVATMLDLHMDKPPELHTLNEDGGRLNLNAIRFLRTLNETIFHYYPNILMLAEDSSSFAAVTKPTDVGGLGFNYKWNMGWMNDMLRYMSMSPEERTTHHHLITFSIWYAFSENFVLPLSHDEVVHGKRSLLNKMWGSYEQKFAQLRMFYGYWITHPGKKLLFMGGEWGQFDEWKDQHMLDWEVLQYESHQSMHRYVKELNHLYRNQPLLWENDFEPETFHWIDVNNAAQSQISFIRKSSHGLLLIVANFSENHYHHYRIGAPLSGIYELLLHSNEVKYGGTTTVVHREIHSEQVPMHGQPHSISIELPPFTCLLYSFQEKEKQVEDKNNVINL